MTPATALCLRGALMLVLGATLAACSGPKLVERASAGFDLNGTWRLDHERSDAPPNAKAMVDRMDRAIVRSSRRQRLGRQLADAAVFAFITQDFPIAVAERLKVEQNADSMGIRYEPGGYRDVSWGEKDRGLWTVNAGWDPGGSLVIRSKSHDMRAWEEHVLLDADTLQVHLQVEAEAGNLDLVRVFVRE
ncbi:MAG: hypothetical protein R3E84_20425 [Pseudomonadales bacterium]